MPEEQPAIALADQTAEVYGTLQTNDKAEDDLRLFSANLWGLSYCSKDNYKAARLKHIDMTWMAWDSKNCASTGPG